MFQLLTPYLIGGDFNALNRMWGSEDTFGRGKIVENLLNICEFCLLNTRSDTYFNISTGKFAGNSQL